MAIFLPSTLGRCLVASVRVISSSSGPIRRSIVCVSLAALFMYANVIDGRQANLLRRSTYAVETQFLRQLRTLRTTFAVGRRTYAPGYAVCDAVGYGLHWAGIELGTVNALRCGACAHRIALSVTLSVSRFVCDRGTLMITYKCRKCRAALESPSSLAGQEDECPSCRYVNIVPMPAKRLWLVVAACAGLAATGLTVALVFWFKGHDPQQGSSGPDRSPGSTTTNRPVNQPAVVASPQPLATPVIQGVPASAPAGKVAKSPVAMPKELRWAVVVLDSGALPADREDFTKELARTAAQAFGAQPGEIVSYTEQALGLDRNPVNISAIRQLVGEADQVRPNQTSNDGKRVFEEHRFGSIVIQVDPGAGKVIGVGAPNGWWSEGLRKKAQDALAAWRKAGERERSATGGNLSAPAPQDKIPTNTLPGDVLNQCLKQARALMFRPHPPPSLPANATQADRQQFGRIVETLALARDYDQRWTQDPAVGLCQWIAQVRKDYPLLEHMDLVLADQPTLKLDTMKGASGWQGGGPKTEVEVYGTDGFGRLATTKEMISWYPREWLLLGADDKGAVRVIRIQVDLLLRATPQPVTTGAAASALSAGIASPTPGAYAPQSVPPGEEANAPDAKNSFGVGCLIDGKISVVDDDIWKKLTTFAAGLDLSNPAGREQLVRKLVELVGLEEARKRGLKFYDDRGRVTHRWPSKDRQPPPQSEK